MRRFGVMHRDRRAVLGLTTRDVAAVAGVSSGHITRIERGTVCPTWAMARSLVEAVGLQWAEYEGAFVRERLLWDAPDGGGAWPRHLAAGIVWATNRIWRFDPGSLPERATEYLTSVLVAPNTPIGLILRDPSVRPKGSMPSQLGPWALDPLGWPRSQVVDLIVSSTTASVCLTNKRYACELVQESARGRLEAFFDGRGVEISLGTTAESVRGLLTPQGEWRPLHA